MKRLLPLLIIVLLGVALPAQAQSTGSFGLRPEDPTQAYFRFTAEPGQVIHDTLMALNDSDTELTLKVTVSRASTALTGGLAFDGTLPKAGEAGSWLTMNLVPGEVVVPARSGIELPFSLIIPKEVPPGDYAFGFVATPRAAKPAEPTAAGFQVQVVSQAAVSVLITVPGADEEQPTAIVRDVSFIKEADGERLAVTIANEGNVGWQGQGTLTLTAPSGEVVLKREFHVGYLLAGDAIPYPIAPDAPLAAGDYTVEVDLGHGTTPYAKTLVLAEPVTDLPETASPVQPNSSLSVTGSANVTGSTNSNTSPKVATAAPFSGFSASEDFWPILLFSAGLVSVLGVGLYAALARRKPK